MHYLSTKKLITVLFLVFCTAFLNTAIAQNKPLLSDEIRKAIDTKGIEATKEQFAGMDQSQRNNYNVDMKGISELTSAYMENGDVEAAGAVSEIAAPFLQDMISKSMNQYAPGMAEKTKEQQTEKEQQEKEREEERKRQEQQRIIDFQGQPRDDLERFSGLYGDPNNPDRKLWVQVSCDGYLVSGAMWGDASPWWLRSESDNVFTYQDSSTKLRMEFKTDGDGKAASMKHDLEHMKSPLKRLGPLPDDWEPCLERRAR